MYVYVYVCGVCVCVCVCVLLLTHNLNVFISHMRYCKEGRDQNFEFQIFQIFERCREATVSTVWTV
jgi:hypothetical protein